MGGDLVGTPVRKTRIRDERLRVRFWRLEQFLELGFSTSEARTLAKSSADLHETRRLIEMGCDRSTAFRLVR
jgi:hypothetical protein